MPARQAPLTTGARGFNLHVIVRGCHKTGVGYEEKKLGSPFIPSPLT